MNLTTKKSKTKAEIKNDFGVDEDNSAEIFSFYEGETKIEGTLLRSFSFDSEEEPVELSITPQNLLPPNKTDLNLNKNSIELVSETSQTNYRSSQSCDNKNYILDNRTLKANPNGRTPSVDGEVYDMIRTYTLRRSTVRILSKIKAIDEAIRYYYEYIKSTNK
jgi:hypothetical protein